MSKTPNQDSDFSSDDDSEGGGVCLDGKLSSQQEHRKEETVRPDEKYSGTFDDLAKTLYYEFKNLANNFPIDPDSRPAGKQTADLEALGDKFRTEAEKLIEQTGQTHSFNPQTHHFSPPPPPPSTPPSTSPFQQPSSLQFRIGFFNYAAKTAYDKAYTYKYSHTSYYDDDLRRLGGKSIDVEIRCLMLGGVLMEERVEAGFNACGRVWEGLEKEGKGRGLNRGGEERGRG